MNCCTEYGKCTQGADCPIRAQCGKLPKPIETDVNIAKEILHSLRWIVCGVLLAVTSIAVAIILNN